MMWILINTTRPTGVEGAGGPGCGARGRQRGLAGQRADAPSHRSATTPHRCGGRRRPWLRRPWAVAGPGRASTATRPHWCGGRRRDRRARAGFEARRRRDCGAWPGFETTHSATHQRPSPTGVKGAGGTGGTGESPDAGPGRGAGGRWQGQGGPRDRPLRAAGSRVAISRAGRRPPAHTAARPIKASHAAPATPVGPQATSQHHTRTQKRPPGTGWAYLSRLWESNPRPIHYE